jgi:flagellar basal body-associated protein FliL
MQPPNEGQQRPPQPPYYSPGQQYGPPPQYPQQPWQQPPPPKKRRTWLWIVLGVLAIVVLGCIGVVALATSASKTTTNTIATTIATSIPTSASTPAPSGQHFKVGQTVKVGDTWQVTVNSAKTSQGDEFTTPTAGNTFVIVDVSLKNLSSTEQNISSALNFSLQDSTGQKYTEIILSGKTPPDGKVEAGSLLRGQLSYEVPTNQKALTFNFEANIISGGQTVWDLKV